MWLQFSHPTTLSAFMQSMLQNEVTIDISPLNSSRRNTITTLVKPFANYMLAIKSGPGQIWGVVRPVRPSLAYGPEIYD